MKAWPTHAAKAGRNKTMKKSQDGTLRLLKDFALPVTRANYLRLAFMGNPPPEPLDQEI
jgi:hypothetical protein